MDFREGGMVGSDKASEKKKFTLSIILEGVIVAICLYYLVMYAVVMVQRVGFPFELQNMEGYILEHVQRLMAGRPIYTRPTPDFVAMLYPPGIYYYLAAISAFFGLGFESARIAIVVVSGFSAVLIGGIVWQKSRSIFWVIASVGLYYSSYGKIGLYLDFIRLDPLLLFLLLCFTCLLIRKSLLSVLSAGLLLAFAIFTKQQAILFFPIAAFWLALFNRRMAFYFVVSAVVCSAILYCYFASASAQTSNWIWHSWFKYFVFELPSAKPASFSISDALLVFSQAFLWRWIPTFVLGIWQSKKQGLTNYIRSDEGLIFALFLVTCIIGSLGLGNAGGDKNVLVPMVGFAALSAALSANRILKEYSKVRSEVKKRETAIILSLIILQLCTLAYRNKNPLLWVHQSDVKANQGLVQMLSKTPGRIYIPRHGFINTLAGKPMEAGEVMISDVLLRGGETATILQRELDSCYAGHRWSLIITDDSVHIPFYRFGRVIPDVLNSRYIHQHNLFVYEPAFY